ncbi:MAG: TonB-dependent receptor [Bacteroidetes bacterium]|nr:TonB-dependent receptor [Bacteroidota bacterium]
MKNYIFFCLFIAIYITTKAQNNADTTSLPKTVGLNEIIISANKTEETPKTVSQQVQILTSKDIANLQAQSTADLMVNTGNVFLQKSQQGGGSPVLRGFEASRVVLVVDGVRMNNLIYRAGHLQNIVTLDNNSLDKIEVLYGPSSTIYGSDALGGVIHMFTKKPMLASDDKTTNIKVNLLSRYGSVNKEIANHIDFNFGTKKFGSLTSFTYSKFGDLMGGRNQNPFYTTSYGERPFYVQRINSKDSLVKNSNRYLQVGSAFSQYDFVQKFSFQQTEKLSHGLNIQYSNSTDVPRYDRLTDPKGAGLNSAEWYYGPQKRLMAAYDMNLKKPEGSFNTIHFGLNYQAIEESRHNRNFSGGSKNFRNSRIENVHVIGANLDFQKIVNTHNFRLGVDMQLNSLTSTASKKDIVADTIGKLDTRYPDGENTMNNFGVYLSHTWQINEQLTLNDGIRVGYSMLHSTLIDTALLFHLPYTNIEQKTPTYSGSIGLIHVPSDDLKLSLTFSTGFRVPNVDDGTKIFGSTPGMVIVPNVKLKPELTYNYELGITKIFNEKAQWENFVYYTHFTNLIKVDAAKFNGQDSIIYDGNKSKVYSSVNKGSAYIYGFSSNMRSKLSDNLFASIVINYTYGRVKTDSMDSPLDHIPPFMARASLTYTHKKFSSDFFVNYNGWKRMKDYGGGEDNPQYATKDGMPAWFTANIRASYKAHKYITLQLGVDNIFDTQYRHFASGINGAGRNVFFAIRGNF